MKEYKMVGMLDATTKPVNFLTKQFQIHRTMQEMGDQFVQ